MIDLAALIALLALAGLALMFGVMVVAGGLRWDDVRDLLLHDAYRSFTFEGDRIPGLAPGFWARFVIRCLSDPDDLRLVLAPEVRAPMRPSPLVDRMDAVDRELLRFAVFRAR